MAAVVLFVGTVLVGGLLAGTGVVFFMAARRDRQDARRQEKR